MKRYYIFQLPSTNPNLFMHFKEDVEINLGDYVPVWTDECDHQDEFELCEYLFQRFNVDHPKNFAGHSMSVSDIIMIKDGNETSLYFCDSIGFKKLEKLKKE